MPDANFTVIDDGAPVRVAARLHEGRVRIAPGDVGALGFELTAEGLCRGGACLLVPEGSRLVTDEGVDLAELAAVTGRPLALDTDERAAYLGVAARDRAEALASLRAPDFTLPDLDGRPHSLAEHRGRKVLLVAWASW
jgi:hypothetical protein